MKRWYPSLLALLACLIAAGCGSIANQPPQIEQTAMPQVQRGGDSGGGGGGSGGM